MWAARSRVRQTAGIMPESCWYLGRPPWPAGDDEAAHGETLSAAPALAEDVAKIIFALDQFEERRVADRADREVPEVGPPERGCRGCGAGPDDRAQFDPEREKFRHCHELVEGRPIDAEGMHIAADDGDIG